MPILYKKNYQNLMVILILLAFVQQIQFKFSGNIMHFVHGYYLKQTTRKNITIMEQLRWLFMFKSKASKDEYKTTESNF